MNRMCDPCNAVCNKAHIPGYHFFSYNILTNIQQVLSLEGKIRTMKVEVGRGKQIEKDPRRDLGGLELGLCLS